MENYIASIEEKGILVFQEGKKNNILAKIEIPALEEEVYLPVDYQVQDQSGEKIGKIQAWIPKQYRLQARFGSETFDLFSDSGQLKLRSRNLRSGTETVFETRYVDLNHFSNEEHKKSLKGFGFSGGYLIKRNNQVGEVHFFEKGKQKRAVLQLEESLDWKTFLLLMLWREISTQLEKKGEKKPEVPDLPQPTAKLVRTPGKEIGQTASSESKATETPKDSYRNYVLTYPIILQEKAVKYIDQDGEFELFVEFMDRGRPVLLNGPTGNGKSTMTKWYAQTRTQPYFKYTGHRDTTLRDIEGMWVPTTDKPVKSPGPLALAMVHGGIFHFEEIGTVSQEILTGLHTLLDEKEITLHSQYGFERIKAHPNFKIVASGNLDRDYTINELNESFLERFVQIKLLYPDIDRTIEIITSVTGIDADTAKMLAAITFDIRSLLQSYRKDFGLRGAVEVAQAIMTGTEQTMRRLIEACMVNPKATYDESNLREKLRGIVNKYLSGGE